MPNPIVREMHRRHFLQHAAMSAAVSTATAGFVKHVLANQEVLRREQKACILIWLDRGAPTIDMWDLKPNSKNGGEFKPIQTSAEYQIGELFGETAKVADQLSIVRTMNTREADHDRARYFLHTAHVPSTSVEHPSFGAIASYELGAKRNELEIPAFVSVGGRSNGPGFLGMRHSPFVVGYNGRVPFSEPSADAARELPERIEVLDQLNDQFERVPRGSLARAHREIYGQALKLMTSRQMQAFELAGEPATLVDRYGASDFGRGLIMARRLVTTGVPFVEVWCNVPQSWDMHTNVFTRSRAAMPILDRGLSALVGDLADRDQLKNVVIVCMGEFGRTPRINAAAGRDHYASAWSVVLGGGGLVGGRAIGETDADGMVCVTKPYSPGDIWATVASVMGIPNDKIYSSRRGRPIRIVGDGAVIPELVGV